MAEKSKTSSTAKQKENKETNKQWKRPQTDIHTTQYTITAHRLKQTGKYYDRQNNKLLYAAVCWYGRYNVTKNFHTSWLHTTNEKKNR